MTKTLAKMIRLVPMMDMTLHVNVNRVFMDRVVNLVSLIVV